MLDAEIAAILLNFCALVYVASILYNNVMEPLLTAFHAPDLKRLHDSNHDLNDSDTASLSLTADSITASELDEMWRYNRDSLPTSAGYEAIPDPRPSQPTVETNEELSAAERRHAALQAKIAQFNELQQRRRQLLQQSADSTDSLNAGQNERTGEEEVEPRVIEVIETRERMMKGVTVAPVSANLPPGVVTPPSRRMPRGDRRRSTLSTISSDDEGAMHRYSEYEPGPGVYTEPPSRQSEHIMMHPHLRSSFETLYDSRLDEVNIDENGYEAMMFKGRGRPGALLRGFRSMESLEGDWEAEKHAERQWKEMDIKIEDEEVLSISSGSDDRFVGLPVQLRRGKENDGDITPRASVEEAKLVSSTPIREDIIGNRSVTFQQRVPVPLEPDERPIFPGEAPPRRPKPRGLPSVPSASHEALNGDPNRRRFVRKMPQPPKRLSLQHDDEDDLDELQIPPEKSDGVKRERQASKDSIGDDLEALRRRVWDNADPGDISESSGSQNQPQHQQQDSFHSDSSSSTAKGIPLAERAAIAKRPSLSEIRQRFESPSQLSNPPSNGSVLMSRSNPLRRPLPRRSSHEQESSEGEKEPHVPNVSISSTGNVFMENDPMHSRFHAWTGSRPSQEYVVNSSGLDVSLQRPYGDKEGPKEMHRTMLQLTTSEPRDSPETDSGHEPVPRLHLSSDEGSLTPTERDTTPLGQGGIERWHSEELFIPARPTKDEQLPNSLSASQAVVPPLSLPFNGISQPQYSSKTDDQKINFQHQPVRRRPQNRSSSDARPKSYHEQSQVTPEANILESWRQSQPNLRPSAEPEPIHRRYQSAVGAEAGRPDPHAPRRGNFTPPVPLSQIRPDQKYEYRPVDPSHALPVQRSATFSGHDEPTPPPLPERLYKPVNQVHVQNYSGNHNPTKVEQPGIFGQQRSHLPNGPASEHVQRKVQHQTYSFPVDVSHRKNEFHPDLPSNLPSRSGNDKQHPHWLQSAREAQMQRQANQAGVQGFPSRQHQMGIAQPLPHGADPHMQFGNQAGVGGFPPNQHHMGNAQMQPYGMDPHMQFQNQAGGPGLPPRHQQIGNAQLLPGADPNTQFRNQAGGPGLFPRQHQMGNAQKQPYGADLQMQFRSQAGVPDLFPRQHQIGSAQQPPYGADPHMQLRNQAGGPGLPPRQQQMGSAQQPPYGSDPQMQFRNQSGIPGLQPRQQQMGSAQQPPYGSDPQMQFRNQSGIPGLQSRQHHANQQPPSESDPHVQLRNQSGIGGFPVHTSVGGQPQIQPRNAMQGYRPTSVPASSYHLTANEFAKPLLVHSKPGLTSTPIQLASKAQGTFADPNQEWRSRSSSSSLQDVDDLRHKPRRRYSPIHMPRRANAIQRTFSDAWGSRGHGQVDDSSFRRPVASPSPPPLPPKMGSQNNSNSASYHDDPVERVQQQRLSSEAAAHGRELANAVKSRNSNKAIPVGSGIMQQKLEKLRDAFEEADRQLRKQEAPKTYQETDIDEEDHRERFWKKMESLERAGYVWDDDEDCWVIDAVKETPWSQLKHPGDLDDPVADVERMYFDLDLDREDLLDRAERRIVPAGLMERFAKLEAENKMDTTEIEATKEDVPQEISPRLPSESDDPVTIRSNSSTLRSAATSLRSHASHFAHRSPFPHKIRDDRAYRRLHPIVTDTMPRKTLSFCGTSVTATPIGTLTPGGPSRRDSDSGLFENARNKVNRAQSLGQSSKAQPSPTTADYLLPRPRDSLERRRQWPSGVDDPDPQLDDMAYRRLVRDHQITPTSNHKELMGKERPTPFSDRCLSLAIASIATNKIGGLTLACMS